MRRQVRSMLVVLAVLSCWAVVAAPAGAAVPGTDVLYTLDADFDKGTAVNLNHEVVPDQLQLNEDTSTFPFVWVSLSQRCTIAKINTETGEILGEFRTVSDDRPCNESSRTTVGLDGSVWVGHRGPGGATHVGLEEVNQCVDRNGNGTIETSTGYGDVLPWTGSDSVVANAQDECILHHVDTDAAPLNFGDTRHMSIDAENNLWIGDRNGGSQFVKVDGATGEILTEKRDFGCGGYGGLIDGNGVIWSASSGSELLRWDPDAPDSATNPRCLQVPNYGLAIDGDGWVWVTVLSGGQVRKVSPDGTTVLGPFPHGSSNAQGLAVDSRGDVWVSSSLFCSSNCTVGHLKNDGTFVGNVPNPTGAGSTGVAVDSAGKIWTANRSSGTATRIDPEGGEVGADGATRIGAVDLTVQFPAGPGSRPAPAPYNYSDMTGAQLLSTTAPQGTWTVTQDSGSEGFAWGHIVWNHETPEGATVKVEVRASDTEAGLGSATFVEVGNGQTFDQEGRFLQVRVTLLPAEDGTSPVLKDIRVCPATGCRAPDTTPAPQHPAATGGVLGTQSRSCLSRRRTTITLRIEKELRRMRATERQVKSVRIVVAGKRVRAFRRGGRWRARVDLRGLPKGRYAVRITVTLKNGRKITGTRRYWTCTEPIPGGPPPL